MEDTDMNKKCIACQSEQLKEVDIITKGAFAIIEKGNKFSINPPKSKIIKYVCLDCGYIAFMQRIPLSLGRFNVNQSDHCLKLYRIIA